MWISLYWNRGVTVGRECCSLLSHFLALAGVPELHVHLVLLRFKRQRGHKKRPNSYDSCDWKLCKEVVMTRESITKFPRSEAVSSLMRKVFSTQFIETNPRLFPLALREAIGRTRTLLRWCHSEATVVDALTKVDNRAHELSRKFLQSRVWRTVWDPEFTCSKKLKQQKKGNQSRTS